MSIRAWRKWARAAGRDRRRASAVPRLEALEDRLAPAVVVTRTSDNAMFASIQAAINDAGTVAGVTLRVSAGTDSEQVTVNKSVILQGAQHGVDARSASRTGLPATETVLDASGNGGTTPFSVTANNVTIDGFTVQNETSGNTFGFAILEGAGTSGTQVLDNIIQNNIAGLSLSNNPAGNPGLVQHNVFKNNNQPGPVSGTAVYTDQFQAGGGLANVTIDANAFLNNTNGGVLIGTTDATKPATNVAISNNTFDTDGNGALLFNTTSSSVTGNTFTGSTATQLVIGGGVNGLQVTQNFIQNGATRGVRVGDFGGGGTNQNVTLFDNAIEGNATAGLEIDSAAGSYTGTLDARDNWWGAATGPTAASNPGGTGDKLIGPSGQVRFRGWLAAGADTQPSTPGFQGDTTQTAGHTITVRGATFTTLEGALFNGAVATVSDDDPFDTAADKTALIAWGDGTTSAGTVSGPTGGPFTVSGSHFFVDEGVFTPTAFVTDTTDNVMAQGPGTANVTEADALALTPASIAVAEGATFRGVVATFSDAGYASNPAADFSATIEWGDGTATAGLVLGAGGGNFTVEGTHVYADEGSFTTRVTVRDDAPGTATARGSGAANVSEADSLTGVAVAVTPAAPGAPSSATATFSDANAAATPAGLTAAIAWGDGSTTPGAVSGGGGTFTVSGSHAYASAGPFTVSVTLADAPPGVAAATASTTATVPTPAVNPPPDTGGTANPPTTTAVTASVPAVTPSVSVAFGPFGEVLEVVGSDGTLTQFDAFGAHTLLGGVRSASVLFGPLGEVLLVVGQDGTLTQYDALGTHTLLGGVRAAGAALGPLGEVVVVVGQDATLTQFDVFGARTLLGGVQSASVAFGPAGEVLEVVGSDGTLTQFDAFGAHTLLGGVRSASAAFGPLGEVFVVVLQDGTLTQFDALGAHVLGKL